MVEFRVSLFLSALVRISNVINSELDLTSDPKICIFA